MKSISASIIILAGAILIASAVGSQRDGAIIAGGLGAVLLLIGSISWIASIGRGPLDKP